MKQARLAERLQARKILFSFKGTCYKLEVFMQIHEKKLEAVLSYPFHQQYSINEILFFDIETTGLSSKMSYLYLIGCVYFKEGVPHLIQWFADGIEDEKELLHHFFSFMENYKVLIHYNGSGFDIPYLQAKCKRYLLNYSFDTITSIDIYKELLPLKKILPTENLKQRSVEEFIGIHREDVFTGGDLIGVYGQYVGIKRYETLSANNSKYNVKQDSGLPSAATSSSDALLYVLLLHNAEDLQGLLKISSMLAYRDLAHGQISYTSYIQEEDNLSLLFELKTSLPQPMNISKTLSLGDFEQINTHDYIVYCSIEGTQGRVTIPYYYGVMKHYFANYKDYYYLPMEDTAIHKSVAEYVEKEYRKKATKETCYVKKEGLFLPQIDMTFTPEFQFGPKDKLSWFDPTVLTNSTELKNELSNYLYQMLTFILSK